MPRIIWGDRALADLADLREYVEQDNPDAAREQALRVVSAVEALEQHVGRGRPGRVAGTRELVVPDTPYIVAYRMRGNRVDVLRVIHGAMRWPRRF